MIADLISRARRRFIGNELLAQGTYAASAGMAGLILLLVAGTQILDWPVLAGISLVTLGIGTYRTLRRIPSAYVIAQLVDRRLFLADALSTALYFARPNAKATASMREAQRDQAERAALDIDLARAVPFAAPRALYALAALGVLASALFALRYGVSRSLDLKAPLARILMENFGATPERAALAANPRARRPDAPQPMGLTIPEGDPNASQLDPAPDSALDTVGVPSAVNDPLGENQANTKASSESAATAKTESEQGDQESSEGADAATAESMSGSPQGQKGSPNANNGKPTSDNAEQNSSLMSKLRDAMSSLLSKMRQQPGSGSQRQQGTGQNSRQAGSQQAGQRASGASGEGRQSAGQESAADGNQQAGAEGKNGQDSQARGSGRSSDQQASNQAGSGIGRQDGNKDTRLAEQLAAMGKISEIFGKRSANVTGEITVEVPSSQQQLRTAYSQSNATHAESGGEISRDEVPVMFQQYVQQYFEQIRKQPPARKPETSTRTKAVTPTSKTQPPSL
jgi:hypothetical protein